MQFGLKQHKIVVQDETNEEKPIFKMEFNVLNVRLFKKFSPEHINEIAGLIDEFTTSLNRFKAEITAK